MIWLICPLCGIFGFIGGTYNKQWRRIGVSTVITLATWISLGWSWWWLGLFASIYGVTTLPFTLRKDGEMVSVFDYIWIWILGYIFGLPSMLIDWRGCIYALIPCIVQGVLGTLSNTKETAHVFKWGPVTFLIWTAVACTYILLIKLR